MEHIMNDTRSKKLIEEFVIRRSDSYHLYSSNTKAELIDRIAMAFDLSLEDELNKQLIRVEMSVKEFGERGAADEKIS